MDILTLAIAKSKSGSPNGTITTENITNALGYKPADQEEVDKLSEEKADKDAIPAKTSQLTNDSDFQTGEQVRAEIGKMTHYKFEKADSLADVTEENVIYLIPNEESKEGNIFDEYLLVDGVPELIGSTAIDLSGYALKEEIPTVPEKLPNPNALTFTGAVTGTYDGSKPLTVNIPSGGGSGGSSGWVKIAEYVWDGNTEFQPLSLDFATGKMTFEETPVSTVVFPVLNLDKLGKGSFVNNYSKIPYEFLSANKLSTLTLDSDAYIFGDVKSITEGGKNANVDFGAFHFERSGSSPEFEGLNTKRCKVRMTIPGGNVNQSNSNFTFYPVLSNGESMFQTIGNMMNTIDDRVLYEIIEQEFNIHSNILTNDYSVKMSTYKQRTNESQNVNVYSFLGQSFAVVDEGVTISSICFIVGNGNHFPCNGTIVEVFEYVG